MDEIEAHLHPRWQQKILPALLRVIEKLKARIDAQVFAGTHSPVVVSSLETHFDRKRDKLFLFDRQDGVATLSECHWPVRGDVTAWLASEVFGLNQGSVEGGETVLKMGKQWCEK